MHKTSPMTPTFFQKTIDANNRTFEIKVLQFENGDFISVTEGANKIGSMVISLAAGPKPITSTVIPSKTDSLFIKLVSERISSLVQGIALVSVNVKHDIDTDSAKAIINEIVEMVRNV